MSTLTLNERRPAAYKPQFFARLARAVLTFIDVYAEAQKMAIDAHRRFPFCR